MAKIAVIEDEAIVRETIIERLSEAGHQVVSAENGMLGIELIRDQQPDLVLCDIMMPNLGGFGVLEYVRKDPQISLIPFIFLSALSDKTDLRKGMLSGADDYLTKPFTKEELLNAVEVRLDKRQSVESSLRGVMDQMRDSISLSLPHEFLTPLNSILGLSHLLREHLEDIQKEEAQEMLGSIHDAGERLLRLVHNYLRYAELESIRYDDEKKAHLLSEHFGFPDNALKDMVNQVAGRAQRGKDIIIRAEATEIQMGVQNFEKVVEELTDNACKFSLDGSRIEITGQRIDGYYELTVMDRGRGMSQQQVQSIGAYQQFDRLQHEQRGVGLGLAIVHSIVDLHGGILRIDSESGKYTAATVLIPAAEGAPEDAEE
ncbi:hybrid sensor histidine kinase/response regulator [bacterium]|nr:hybrid sensor histidine kinase/response regulator [bacterium]